MARHRQRDMEAGGDGLGIVETRKRLWEDNDGNVVENRPSTPPPTNRCRKRRRANAEKEHLGESLQESLPIFQSYMPQTTSPICSKTDSAHTEEQTASPVALDNDASDFLKSWGLMSPADSVDRLNLSQSSSFDHLFLLQGCKSRDDCD